MRKICIAILILAFIPLAIYLIKFVSPYVYSPKITEGEIYEKEYRKSYTTTQIFPLVTSDGKTATTTMIPYNVYYPERYVIYIKVFKNNKWITEDYFVTQEVYDNTNIGDMFSYDKKRGDLENEPYTIERKIKKES